MKPSPVLFLPGAWIAATLPIAILIGSDSATQLRSVGVFLLLSYVVAAPSATVCSIIGLIGGIRNWDNGIKQKVSVVCHCAVLCVAGYFCLAIVNFPRIGPH